MARLNASDLIALRIRHRGLIVHLTDERECVCVDTYPPFRTIIRAYRFYFSVSSESQNWSSHHIFSFTGRTFLPEALGSSEGSRNQSSVTFNDLR